MIFLLNKFHVCTNKKAEFRTPRYGKKEKSYPYPKNIAKLLIYCQVLSYICTYKCCIVMNRSYFQTIHEIITTGHWITDEISKALKEYGITEPQYNVLRILRGAKGKPVTVGGILDNMVQRSSNITRIVDKLVGKKLAERTTCPTNRRKMDIIITTKGLALLKQLDQKVLGFHQPYFQKLSMEELDTLKRLIRKLKA